MQAVEQLVSVEPVRLPINHAFSGCAPPKHTRAIAVELVAAHLPWGRLPEYTHTLSWKYCRHTGNAGVGGGMLEQDCLLIRHSMIFTTIALRDMVTYKPIKMHAFVGL